VSRIRPRHRALGVALVALLFAALAPMGGSTQAFAGPVAINDDSYLACGRAFPDPQAFWVPTVGEETPHPGAGTSPFAKGNAPCAARTFMTYNEAIQGLSYLDSRPDTGPFMEVINLATTNDPKIREVLNEELGDGWSEGLATTTGEISKSPMYLIKVTAPEGAQLIEGVDQVAAEDRDHFVWSLSMHGIERAGIEGGVRAIEDLVTWGATEPDRRLLETYDSDTIQTINGHEARNLPVGEVLMHSVSYFMLSNPDGWRRGDPDAGGASFMRFNGNGMDLNRDWPELGWTDDSFTPWSESETRTYGKVLQNISDNWTGGIDLHGMVEANAFSYTLVGGSQRKFDKNERTMQFVEQAWDDAEKRLLWSSIIKPNTAPDQCVEFAGVAPTGETNSPPECDQRSYGVQYGTIWDTIEYTVTGAVGNWIDSPVGLNADGIDNEMMMSHLGNCGGADCYVPEFEQLHVDGNKSLIYAMLNFSVQPPPAVFDSEGDVGYFVNPRRLVDPGTERPAPPGGAVAPSDLSGVTNHQGLNASTTVLDEFTVDNTRPEDYIGGVSIEARFANVQGESYSEATNTVRIQRQNPAGQWVSGRRAYGSGAGYRQAGYRNDWNYPEPGNYRVVITGAAPSRVTWEINFSTTPVWEQPIQRPFDVSNMEFFKDLDPFMGPNSSLTAVSVDRVLSGERSLADFDTIVIADDALLPGYREANDGVHQGALDLPATSYTAADKDAIAAKLRAFVHAGGNLSLSDDALRALDWMGIVPPGAVQDQDVYAGSVSFTTDASATDTYADPLSAGIDRPGSAEGLNNRRQTVEPIPLGYELGGDGGMLQWHVGAAQWRQAGGRVVGTEGEGNSSTNRVSYGELELGAGRIRILGALLPFPTTANYHPFGLGSYAVTDNGYILAQNMWTWQSPAQNAAPVLADDPITWVTSGTPTQKQL
jgi:Zinc carboxypeptidase